MILSSLEVYHDHTSHPAALNMALDEVLWQSSAVPRLRLYEWDHPAISFGYFVRYAEVAQYEGERELVRRSTGGGIVFHGTDLTYALSIPPAALPEAASAISVYAFVHEAIKQAFSQGGISATLAESAYSKATSKHSINSCFANPVQADVLVGDRKVAGAAQRRSGRGLLQQGSIQNISLSKDFRRQFINALACNVIQRDIDSDMLDEARELAARKYGADAWLKRR